MANEVSIGVTAQDRGATRTLNQAEQQARGLSRSLSRVGEVAGGMLAADLIGQIGDGARRALGSAARAASGLEQAIGGTTAVFGEASDAIDEFARTSAESVGLSEREFREATTLIGGQLKRMTGDVQVAATASLRLVEVGADLAATYGGTTKEAVDAFAAALRGEADPAERFNLNLKVSAVNAKAVELGLAASTSAVDEAARAQALLALVLEQSADAQGQFAREADTAAVAQQKANAAWENAQAALGQTLTPLMAKGAEAVSLLAEGLGALPEPIQLTTAAIGVLGGALAIVIPRIAAARDGLIALGLSARAANRSLGVIGIALGVATTAMIAFGLANQEATPKVDTLSSSLDDQTGAITENTRKLIVQRLEREGALRAAKEFGIALGDVVKATLGEQEATDRLHAAIVRHHDALEVNSDASDRSNRLAGRLIGSYQSLEVELNEARSAWVRQHEAIQESSEVAQQHTSVLGRLASQTGHTADELTSAWQDASEGFVSSVDAMNDASAELREDQQLTTEMLLEQLREQVEAQRRWRDNMIELARRVPPAILNELARLGPEGAQLVQLLTEMTDVELQEYIELMQRRGRTAGGALISEVLQNFIEGTPKLRAVAQQQGREVAERIARGMRERGTTVEQEARRLGLRISGGLGGPFFVDIIPRVRPTQGHLPGQFIAHGGIVGGMAAGGISGAAQQAQAGGPRGGADVVVGELGPEIAQLPFGTRVVPSGQSEAMLHQAVANPGSTVTVNLFVQGSIRSDRDLVELIRDELLNGGFRGVLETVL